MELKWDGSDLGKYSKDIIKSKQWVGKTEYWQMFLFEKIHVVIARATKDSFACVSDELKTIFGLNKLGTHLIRIGAKLYFLSRPVMKDGVIIEELSLKDFPQENLTELFVKQVQEAFAFRELMGFSQSYEDNIHVRQSRAGFFYPISFREVGTSLEKSKKSLPNSIITKWFGNNTLKSVTCRLIGVVNPESYEEITSAIGSYRSKIEDVINRVDREYIWCSVYICDRLTNVLI